MAKRKIKKLSNDIITPAFLKLRYDIAKNAGYPNKAKWIEFCEELLQRGYTLSLYEARQTFSKYITVAYNDKRFKVRFSNHKPIHARELAGDCDFFVGVTHLGVSNTSMALRAVAKHFTTKE